jgi:hypothetical protein
VRGRGCAAQDENEVEVENEVEDEDEVEGRMGSNDCA